MTDNTLTADTEAGTQTVVDLRRRVAMAIFVLHAKDDGGATWPDACRDAAQALEPLIEWLGGNVNDEVSKQRERARARRQG